MNSFSWASRVFGPSLLHLHDPPSNAMRPLDWLWALKMRRFR